MDQELIALRLQPRGKPLPKLPTELPITSNASIDQLYAAVAKLTGYSIHRIRITKSDSSHLKPSGLSLEQSNVYDQSSLFVKDLGPQIPWRTVYVIEYLGPLLFHPLMLLLRRQVYAYYPPIWQWTASPLTTPPTTTQLTLCAICTLHYIKRELETVFIHRFSAATMPFNYVYRNSAHYWILGGLYIAYFFYMPTKWEAPDYYYYPGLAIWAFAEISNFISHKTLRDLRRPGTKDRGIPRGYGFNLVTCPNYMFEVLGWAAVAMITGFSIPALIFLAVALTVQTKWAIERERRYRKEFGDKYKKKKYAIIPFVI